jgi:hypothetical protein
VAKDLCLCGCFWVSWYLICSLPTLKFVQVFGDLSPGGMQLQMVSVASVLEAMGYETKVRYLIVCLRQ